MDTGKGYFEEPTKKVVKELERQKIDPETVFFKKGEVLKIKESFFKISAIGKRQMTLTLLPKFEGELIQNSLLKKKADDIQAEQTSDPSEDPSGPTEVAVP